MTARGDDARHVRVVIVLEKEARRAKVDGVERQGQVDRLGSPDACWRREAHVAAIRELKGLRLRWRQAEGLCETRGQHVHDRSLPTAAHEARRECKEARAHDRNYRAPSLGPPHGGQTDEILV